MQVLGATRRVRSRAPITLLAEARVSTDFDTIIIGSGFGGAVCAARLSSAGYRVLVLERGSLVYANISISAKCESFLKGLPPAR